MELLGKGESLSLSDKAPNLKKLYLGMGWDAEMNGKPFDLDLTAVFCDNNNKVIGINYFGSDNMETKGSDGVYAKHSDDDRTGDSSDGGDDEYINITLDKVPSTVEKIHILCNIYNGSEKQQTFDHVKNAFVRVVDGSSDTELAKHNLTNEFAGKTGVIVAEIYKLGSDWKFKALSEPTNEGDKIENMIKEKGWSL